MGTNEDDFVLKAEALARKIYAGKYRSGESRRAYIEHPLALVAILRRHGVSDPITLAGALLHDAIEESNHDPQVAIAIKRESGAEVLALVLEVTDLGDVSREERRAEQIARAKGYSIRAGLVRTADKLANLSEILATPPKWAPKHVIAYAGFAMQVVAVCGHVCPAMALECQQAFEQVVVRYAVPQNAPQTPNS